MKAFLAATTAAVFAAAVPALSHAQEPAASPPSSDSPIYGSLGYSQGGYDGADVGAVEARLGARLNKYIGGEAELAKGIDHDRAELAGTRVKTQLKHQASIYGVGYVPLSPNADVFARAGYGNTKLRTSAPGLVATTEGDSWNYGVGAQYFMSKNGVRADWTRQEFKHDRGEADTWSLGYVRKF